MFRKIDKIFSDNMYIIEPEFIVCSLKTGNKLTDKQIEGKRRRGEFTVDHARAVLDAAVKV